MPNNRLLAVVTMLVLLGAPAQAQQVVTIDDLRTIETLIIGKDWRALYAFLINNPRLTQGNDPLAVELRTFVSDVQNGKLESFAAGADPFKVEDPPVVRERRIY